MVITKKTEKKEETIKLIELLRKSYYIVETISKLSNFICMVLMISSLTLIVVGISLSNYTISSIAFWLLLSCIIMYFVKNYMKVILPRLNKNIQLLTEYYKQNFEETN